MAKRPKAYLNALAEEGTRSELIDWLVKLDSEIDDLKDNMTHLKEVNSAYETKYRALQATNDELGEAVWSNVSTILRDRRAASERIAELELLLNNQIEITQNRDLQLHNWKTQIKMPSYAWMELPEFRNTFVLDPDGWDRQNFQTSWDEEICYEEFLSRYMRSTVVTRNFYGG